MAKIKIVGQEGTYDLESVADVVIQLGGEYFFKHDEDNLVRVRIEGKTRLYRKTSPLICYTLNRNYVIKKDCYEISPTIFIEKNHPNTVKLEDGTITHSEYCVKLDNKYYLKSDPRLVKTIEGNRYLISDCIALSTKYYSTSDGTPKYIHNSYSVVVTEDGHVLRPEDAKQVTFWQNGAQAFKYVHRNEITSSKGYIGHVFAGFRDPSNPQDGRFEECFAKADETSPCSLGCNVLTQQLASLEEALTAIREAAASKTTETARKNCNARFSDHDATENVAKRISSEYRVWGGKENLFGHIGEPVTSRQFSLTGGLGYSFGVEIETSAGKLSASTADLLGIQAVGDRSIGAAEYVTAPLQGNRGINHLKKVFAALAESTFVDDRCSIHVHVGSPPVIGATDYSIDFNREFAIASIKLGTTIEEELYQILPVSRNPYNKYCHSIMRYKGINEDNWKEYLGTFVFGPKENWNERLNFSNYTFGAEGRTKTTRLGTWADGRYKWLNLIRAYSACSARTIEFRIFSPTVNFDKAYQFVLISLAFTYVAQNHYREVMEGKLTLNSMLELAYKDHPTVLSGLTEFIAARKAKFNRKVVYTAIKPEQIVSVEPTIRTFTTTNPF